MNNTIGGAKETARSRLFARISKEQVVVALDQPRLSLDSRTYTRAPPRSVVDSRSKLPTLWPSSPLRPSALGVEAWSPPDADQLAGLLAPFHIISLTVHPPGLPDGKGYRRSRTASAWPCPSTRLRASRFDESLHCSEGDGINGRRRQAFLASFGQLDRIFITTYSCILSCIEATTAFCRSRAKRRQHRKFRT
jgi:hypothetical protein